MESDNAQEVIKSLNPACTLRYSATHRQSYNRLYRLDPVKVYELELVKRIEANLVNAEAGSNDAYIMVQSITATKKKVTAVLEIDIAGVSDPLREVIKVSARGEDLYKLSGQRDCYRG